MSAARCSACGISWPDAKDYRKCPQCQGKTDAVSNETAIDSSVAASLANHAEFERYYAKWENDRTLREAKALAEEMEKLEKQLEKA